MKRLPLILAAVFIAITLTRVASLVEHGFSSGLLGWAFSFGLGVAVFVTSYFMRVAAASSKTGMEDKRSRNTRAISAIALVFFVLVDGYFNVVEVLRSLTDQSLYVAALLYGAFPTVAAALLGVLQGYVDRLPSPPTKYNIMVAVRAWITNRIERRINQDMLPEQAAPQDDEKKTQFIAWAKKLKRTPKLSDVMLKFEVPVAVASQWISEVENGMPF